jgi:hypothetical protein
MVRLRQLLTAVTILATTGLLAGCVSFGVSVHGKSGVVTVRVKQSGDYDKSVVHQQTTVTLFREDPGPPSGWQYVTQESVEQLYPHDGSAAGVKFYNIKYGTAMKAEVRITYRYAAHPDEPHTTTSHDYFRWSLKGITDYGDALPENPEGRG